MGQLKNYLYGIMAASILAGCSDEAVNPGNTPTYGPEDAVYMQASIKLPSTAGSRSQTGDPDDNYSTSTDGTEVGSEAENRVYTVMLVLAGPDNGFIGYSIVGGLGNNNENPSGTPNNNSVTVTTSFDRQAIADFYDGSTFDPTKGMNVYALCNYTQAMLETIKGTEPGTTTWIDGVQTVEEYSPSSGQTNSGTSVLSVNGGLFMSNATISNKSIPQTEEEWDAYTSKDDAFNLSGKNGDIDNTGSIKVERGVARFDFADGSEKGDQEYVVGTTKNAQGEDVETMKVKLVRMALVNMNKEFYYFRHVADANKSENYAADLSTVNICKPELMWDLSEAVVGNWVVGPDAEWKNTYFASSKEEGFIPNTSELNEHFNFSLGGNGNAWGITPDARNWWYNEKISTVLGGAQDNWAGNANNTRDYKVWRYVTENCIPTIDGQINGLSTGIVFKGQILPCDDAPADLKAALNGDYKSNASGVYDENGDPENPILYAFDDVIYVKWTQVREEAIKHQAGSPLYNAVYGSTPMLANGTPDTSSDVYKDCADYLYSQWKKDDIHAAPAGADFDAFRKKVVSEQITIYEYSTDAADADDSTLGGGKTGYFCYYYYWNRHNDNERNGVMGPMEFQVVRNNVYKLAVTEIDKLGHPRKTENDPDPEDPGTPDEESKVYFKVNVMVLPWLVRVNNIEF